MEWTSRFCLHVFPHGTVNNRTEVWHFSSLSAAGGASLSTVPSGNGLILPGKAAGVPCVVPKHGVGQRPWGVLSKP